MLRDGTPPTQASGRVTTAQSAAQVETKATELSNEIINKVVNV